MSARRAVTLPEILVVAAILCGSLGAVILWQRSSASANQHSAQDQEYANLLARLAAALREDLRSASAIARPATGTWVLTLWRRSDKGVPVREEIRYQVSGKDGAVIARTGANRNTRFDFTGLIGGDRFVFEIDAQAP